MKPMFRTATAALLLTALAGTSLESQACGEVMYRMGGALRYRAFVTRHPATILVYSDNAAQQQDSADAVRFHENLQKAGHKVTVAHGQSELTKALEAQSYDVVIAFAADMDNVNRLLARAAREPALIPVIDRGAPNEKVLREKYPRLVTEDANLNQFLKVIEQTMKSRGA